MEAKEKAKELYWKYYQKVADSSYPENLSKHCALIAVEEILKSNVVWYEGSIPYKYWQEVKKEILKL